MAQGQAAGDLPDLEGLTLKRAGQATPFTPQARHATTNEGKGRGEAGRHFPHRWRHRYATSLVRRGKDIHVVQRLMGHSNIATTRYLHLSDADLLAAIDLAFPES